MSSPDVLIIGAGVAGLMAGKQLAGAGFRVIILEANNRIGGRIHTLTDGFSNPVDLGAEFIHGMLPLTFKIVKEAGIPVDPVKENSAWEFDGKVLKRSDFFSTHFGLIRKHLQQLEEDISVKQFLEEYFPKQNYPDIYASVKGFVEGFDAADISRVSAFELRDEWLGEHASQQFRPAKGYGQLAEFLKDRFLGLGGKLFLNETVKTIHWSLGKAIIRTDSEEYLAPRVIVTVPVGVLMAPNSETGIRFLPEPSVIPLFSKTGFGGVIKFILEFQKSFWPEDLSFLVSGAPIPTWWRSERNPLVLTGWLAGPGVEKIKSLAEATLLEHAVASLAAIFSQFQKDIQHNLKQFRIVNWATNPFSLGAYSYMIINDKEIVNKLKNPLEETLFFAGEALYSGPYKGTVEAALQSGSDIANHLIDIN